MKLAYAGWTIGWVPTLIGYSLQGLGKFGFYELFKDLFTQIFGVEKAHTYRTYLYIVSSSFAEIIADIFLCPFEATKLRMQISKLGTFPL